MDAFVDFASELNLVVALLVGFAVMAVHLLCMRNSFYGLADPLFVFCIFNSFSIVTTIFVSQLSGDYSGLFDLLIFNICFFSWSLCMGARPKKGLVVRAIRSLRRNEADVFIGVLACITFISTLALWIFVGVPFLAENPSEAKVTMYQGGFGFVRYIHFLAPPVLSMYAMFELGLGSVKKLRKVFMWLCVVGSAIVAVSAGSKSSLLFLAYNLGFIIYISPSGRILRSYKRFMVYVVVASIVVMLVILGSTKEGALSGLVLRVFASGDIFFFWYLYDLPQSLSSFRPVEFLVYLASPLFGMFGLVQQEFPVGAVILNEAVGYPLSSFGPNAQLPVLARMYFGDFSYVAALAIGYLFFYIRRESYRLIRYGGVVGYFVFVIVYFGSVAIFIDISYFMSLLSAGLVVLFVTSVVTVAILMARRLLRRAVLVSGGSGLVS
jgi:hypothetical protein